MALISTGWLNISRDWLRSVHSRKTLFICTLFLLQATAQAEPPSLDTEGYFQSGNQMLERGKWAEAIPLYQSVLVLDSNHCGAHMNLGCALALDGQYEQAIAELQKALALEVKPFTAFALLDIGGIHMKRALLAASKKEDARDYFEQAAISFARAVEVLPKFELANDWAHFCTSYASSPRMVLLVDGVGLPPDTGRFLGKEKVTGTNESTGLQFDSETPAPLYFYRSAGTLLLAGREELRRGFVENAASLGKQALGRIGTDAGQPLDRLTRWNTLMWLSSVVSLNGSWDEALDYLDRARNIGIDPALVEKAWLNTLLGKGDYTTARAIAQIILARNPEDPFALGVAGLQFQSPRVQADGYYVVPEHPFRVKKPAGWLVFDRETNMKTFEILIANFTSKESVLCILAESVYAFSPMLIFRVENFSEPMAQEKYMAWMDVQLQRTLSQHGGTLLEKPTQIEMDGISFIRYRMEKVDDQSGLPYVSTSWIHLGERWSLEIDSRVPKHQLARYLPVFEEVVKGVALSIGETGRWKELNSKFLVLFQQGKISEAAEVASEQMGLANKLFVPGDSRFSMTLETMAAISESQGRFSDTEKFLLQSLEMQSKLPWPDRSNIAVATGMLGEFYLRQKDYGKAEFLQRQALETWQAGRGPKDPDLWLFMNRLAHVEKAIGHYGKAEQLYRQAESSIKDIHGENSQDLTEVLFPLADLYASLGRYSEAEGRYLEAVALKEKVLGREHPDLIGPLNGLAESYKGQGKHRQAEELYRRILALKQKIYGPEDFQTMDTLENLAEVCAQQGRFSEANAFYQRVLSLAQSFPKPDDAHMARLLNDLARVKMAEGSSAEAETLYQESLAMVEKALGADHPIAATYRLHLASFYVDRGRYDEAYPLFERALEIRNRTGGSIDTSMRDAAEKLVTLLRRHGLSEKADRMEMRLRETQESSSN